MNVDVLVIGSGIAGVVFSLKAAQYGSVAIVSKKGRLDSSTNYAQGGIAAVFDPDDTPDLHVADTLVAGAGPCHGDMVRLLVNEGAARVRELVDWGFSLRGKVEGYRSAVRAATRVDGW